MCCNTFLPLCVGEIYVAMVSRMLASATRVYAKVDLLGLREVAAFDLGELS
jgi:hypothetical protein